MLGLLEQITPRDLLDIGLVTVALYAAIVWLRRVRASLAVTGALFLGIVYLAARELRLEVTARVFQGFFTLFLIVLALVLQHDLRRSFERVALWALGRRRPAGRGGSLELLLTAAQGLARSRRGALIVIPGRDPVDRYIEGGEELDGRVSVSLLMSLFDPSSPGHDGAVIVDQDRVTKFAVHLPLSNNFHELQQKGTRHSAALGLSELTDAICIVVSEERGEAAVAKEGQLYPLSLETERFPKDIDSALDGQNPAGRRSTARFAAPWRSAAELFVAGAVGVALWFVFSSGGEVSQRVLRAPVLVDNIHPDYELESVKPKEVEITLSGLRPDLYLLDPTIVDVRLDAFLVGIGRRTFQIYEAQVRHPEHLEVQSISPDSVTVRVRRLDDSLSTEQERSSESAME